MQMQDKIVINDYIENDPLSEENLDKILETVDEIQRNPSKKWAGSDNQRVISIQESLKQRKIVLYCDEGSR